MTQNRKLKKHILTSENTEQNDKPNNGGGKSTTKNRYRAKYGACNCHFSTTIFIGDAADKRACRRITSLLKSLLN